MRSVSLALPGAVLIEPAVYADARGAFFEAWNERAYAAAGIEARFVQENVSVSRRHVLRGLHYQVNQVQGKLIRVLAGSIFDVIVDLRRSSGGFGRSVAVTLDAREPRSLWVPAGLAHGFLALSEDTQVQYKVTDFWAPQAERTLAWNDPALGIDWPLPPQVAPVLSDKDQRGQTLAQCETFP
ncbi:MAG: dTDP-4-dehydrorhamnose 3,5-epimerase [Gammaproteobacteria bacterium]|nr:dTDP-4-dehydrorhamnose 3,5-epimerase [Gammaproteobacteria bacterium]MBV8405239.1 dTDP-4-dehydrorhamnose 3,5-epimerase [Gammaproteobacteria bacterium]